MKKFGFSIAEMLISIGLLAFVVVLLMPTVKNDQNQEEFYQTQYAKVFNDIYTVSRTIMIVDFKQVSNFSGRDAATIRNLFASHFDIISTWQGNATRWVNLPHGALAQRTRNVQLVDMNGLTLNNGVSIGIVATNNVDFPANIPLQNIVGVLFFDINGSSGPNELNKDQYGIPLYVDGIHNNISYRE